MTVRLLGLMMEAEITREIDNFDALGLFSSEMLRDEVMERIPAWHYEGISCIRYAPNEFERYYLGGDRTVLGAYRKATHEIFINSFDMGGLLGELVQLKAAAVVWSDTLDLLGRKRERVEKTAVCFERFRKKVLGTVYHEIGHHLYGRLSERDADFRGLWERIFQLPSRKVSHYATTSPEENFAECYRVYVCQRKTINQVLFQTECSAMRDIFQRKALFSVPQ